MSSIQAQVLSLNRVLSVVLGSMRARIQMASGCPWHPHHMKCQELRKNVLPKGKRIDFDLGSLGLRIWGVWVSGSMILILTFVSLLIEIQKLRRFYLGRLF